MIRKTLGRFFIRIVIVVTILAVLCVIVVAGVLHSDLPRHWTVDKLTRLTGVEFECESLTIGWRSPAIIENLSLSLPTEDGPFISVRRVVISHAALPVLLLKRIEGIESIKIDGAEVNIRQDRTGRWNFQQIASKLRLVLGQDVAKRLPMVEVGGAIVTITNEEGRCCKINGLELKGKAKSDLLWIFDMSVAGLGTLKGTLAPVSDWAFDVEFELGQFEQLFEPWAKLDVKMTAAAGKCLGRFEGGHINGQLDLKNLQIDRRHISGMMAVDVGGGEVTLRPEGLRVHLPDSKVEDMIVREGMLRLGRDRIDIDKCVVEGAGAVGQLEGQWNWQDQKADFKGSWVGKTVERGIQHDGSWQVFVSAPQVGLKQATGEVIFRAQSELGNLQGRMHIAGSGRQWQKSQWQVSMPDVSWQRAQMTWKLQDIVVGLAVAWPEVKLTEAKISNAKHIEAAGIVLVDNGSWSLNLDAKDIRIEGWQREPADLSLTLEGTTKRVSVSKLQIQGQDVKVSASGKIDLGSMEVEDVRVAAELVVPAGQRSSKDLAGMWQLESMAKGNLHPLNVDVKCKISGSGVSLGQVVVPYVQVQLSGELDSKEFACKAEPFEFLEGQWSFMARHRFSSQVTEFDVAVEKMPFKIAAEMANSPLEPKGIASASFKVTIPKADLKQMVVDGDWKAENLEIMCLKSGLANGRIKVENGLVRLDKIVLEQTGGRAEAETHFRLDQPQVLHIEVSAEHWPVELNKENLIFIANGQATAELDVAKWSADGQGHLKGSCMLDGKELGELSADVGIRGKTVEIANARFDGLGGVMSGMATIPLNDYLAGSGELEWEKIDLSRLGNWWDYSGEVAGESSGRLKLTPAQEVRVLGPLKVEMTSSILDGRFRNTNFGGITMQGYLGQRDFVIEQSKVQVAGGLLEVWASMSRHVGRLYTNVHADFNNLDLNQLVHSVSDKANPVAGKLGGKVLVVIAPDLRRLTAEADLHLSESDLLKNDIIGTVYNTLNLRPEKPEPTGQGQIKLRAEGSRLYVVSFYHYNRGVEVRGSGLIHDVAKGQNSSIEGYAFGSNRTLRELRLPGVTELDKLINSLRATMTSVKIGGTVSSPELVVAPFVEAAATLRQLLWSQLRE